MRDEDEDTRPLRFGVFRPKYPGDKPLGQQIKDDEDRYWGVPEVVERTYVGCIYCGREVPEGCPHPSMFACCGEVGHTEVFTERDDDEIQNV